MAVQPIPVVLEFLEFLPLAGAGWALAWLGSRGSSACPGAGALLLLLLLLEPVNIMGSMSVENHFVGQQGRAEELAGLPAALPVPGQPGHPSLSCPALPWSR